MACEVSPVAMFTLDVEEGAFYFNTLTLTLVREACLYHYRWIFRKVPKIHRYWYRQASLRRVWCSQNHPIQPFLFVLSFEGLCSLSVKMSTQGIWWHPNFVELIVFDNITVKLFHNTTNQFDRCQTLDMFPVVQQQCCGSSKRREGSCAATYVVATH